LTQSSKANLRPVETKGLKGAHGYKESKSEKNFVRKSLPAWKTARPPEKRRLWTRYAKKKKDTKKKKNTSPSEKKDRLGA